MVTGSDCYTLGCASMKIIKLPARHIPDGCPVNAFVRSKNKGFNKRLRKAIDQEYTQYNEQFKKTIEEELDDIK